MFFLTFIFLLLHLIHDLWVQKVPSEMEMNFVD